MQSQCFSAGTEAPQRSLSQPVHSISSLYCSCFNRPLFSQLPYLKGFLTQARTCDVQPTPKWAEDLTGPRAGLRCICPHCLGTLAGATLLSGSAQVLPLVQSCTLLKMSEGLPLV